ncbi:MAG: serine hydrolase domain-containing protein [bacterium]
MRTMQLGLILAAGLLLAASGCTSSNGPSPRPRTARPDNRPAPDARPARRARLAPRKETPVSVRLTKDTTVTTPSGARVTVPARWILTRHAAHVILHGPDRGLWVALVERKTKTAREAISQAWALARPGFALKERQTVTPPARDGWDSITQITYVTPSTSRRVVVAAARGRSGVFYVALLDGKVAAFSRRGAQLQTVLSSLKAPGVQKESWAGRGAATLDSARLKTFEAFLEEARQKLDIPGAAVAVVQGGKVIFAKGFGVRRLGQKRAVTTKTLFMIGSITKSLTTMMMAKLVDEKKFDWETPVTQVLPSFALGDVALTRQCRMRHTVCACTGLPRQDMEFLFESKRSTAESRMALLKTMKPTTGFGETFQYSNLMVAAGGYVAAHAAYPRWKLGRAYHKAMQTRLFQPAGMRRTTFDFRRVRRLDHAQPHSPTLQMKPVPISLAFEDGVRSVGPAGAAWSNVEDMARFVLLELSRGRIGKAKRVVSDKQLQARWQPQIRASDKVHYGLALLISRDRGVRIIGHGGGTLGFTSNMFFLPDHGVGMIVLSNRGGASGFTSAVTRRLLELVFDGKDVARTGLAFRLKMQAEDLAKSRKRITYEPTAAWVKTHAGTYHNAALGTVKISWKRKAGAFDAGEWQAPLAKHTARDGVVRLLIGPPLAGLPFLPGKKDGRRTLTLQTGQQKYVFQEQGAGPRKRPVPRRR